MPSRDAVAADLGWAQQAYHGPKTRWPVAWRMAHSSATSSSLIAASARMRVRDLGGRVRLAAVGHRGEERRVGLGQQLAGRCDRGRLAQLRRVAERQHAREAEQVAGRHAALGQLGVAGETVEDHRLRRAFLGQDAQDVLVRVPVVDHQRLGGLLGQRDVRAEPVLLDVVGRVVPVVVETGLADRPDLGQRGQLGQFFEHLIAIRGLGRLVRVDGHRRVDLVMVGRGGHRRVAGRQVGADRDHSGDAGRGRLGEHVFDRAEHQVQVAVRVERAGRQRRRIGGGRAPVLVADRGAHRFCPVTAAPAGPVPPPRWTGPAW